MRVISTCSTPAFRVKKPIGKWRIVNAYNKLNAATFPANTYIPRKDVLQKPFLSLNYNEQPCTPQQLAQLEGYVLFQEFDKFSTLRSTVDGTTTCKVKSTAAGSGAGW